MLVLASEVNSSSDNITISQYTLPEVIRRNTPFRKEGHAITGTKDIVFNTPYPIYRFEPTGNIIDPMAFLRIYLNKDQEGAPDDFTLL